MWAVLLGVLLVLVAAISAHAATLVTLAVHCSSHARDALRAGRAASRLIGAPRLLRSPAIA